MIDSKIMETTKPILKDFGNTYFSDKGTLKRNKVIEDLDAYTPMLMKALLANQLIHDTYTAQKSINWTIFIQLIRRHLRYDCDYKNCLTSGNPTLRTIFWLVRWPLALKFRFLPPK